MTTSKYEIIKLLEERRELEGRLSEVNAQLTELDINPYRQENHSRKSGFPILGDIINLMLDTLVRVVRWIVNQILR